jgi:hypothetical protein
MTELAAEWTSPTDAEYLVQVGEPRASTTLVLVYSETGTSGGAPESMPLNEAFAEWADESLELADVAWEASAESWPSY